MFCKEPAFFSQKKILLGYKINKDFSFEFDYLNFDNIAKKTYVYRKHLTGKLKLNASAFDFALVKKLHLL